MKKILLTGQNGFIGSALVAKLKEIDGIGVKGVSRNDGTDLTNKDFFLGIDDITEIVHLAGSVGVESGWKFPYEMYQNNLMPTLTLLEFARQRRIPFIYISSYVYGEPQYLPIDESHPIKCNNPYAHSKRQAEILCEAYATDFKVPVTIIRPFNVYGPGQSKKNVISQIIHQVIEKDCITVRDLSPKRDFLYVDDLSSALLKVLLADEKREGLDVFNIGYGKSHSVADIIDVVVSIVGKSVPVHVAGKKRPNEVMNCYCDSSKFSKRHGWKPETSIAAGISKFLSQLRCP